MPPIIHKIKHVPVLISDFKNLFPEIKGIWVDGTFGFGGYSDYLLKAGAKKLIVLDLDPDVKKYVKRLEKKWPNKIPNHDYYQSILTLPGIYYKSKKKILGEVNYIKTDDVVEKKWSNKINFFNSNFIEIKKIITSLGIEDVEGVFLDIGVSSMQLDKALRGFSFKQDGPLDMRMSRDGPTASDFINKADENLISEVIFKYGEEKRSKIIARHIVQSRKNFKIDTTYKLSKIIEGVLGFKHSNKKHPATKSFQAIRIAINNELNNLVFGLYSSYDVLKIGGILAIITFHSLEDRLVKRFFNQVSRINNPLSELKKVGGISTPLFEKINKKPIVASEKEIQLNPRARSAKLRVVRKLSNKSFNVDTQILGLPQISESLKEFQCV